jgi:hypothetical protein
MFLTLVLLTVGLGLILVGWPGVVSAEMKVRHDPKGSLNRHTPSRGRPQGAELSGREARWFGGGLVSVGSGLLLALVLVPGAVDAHFRRTKILGLPYWQLGLACGVAVLVVGGLGGIFASFGAK